MVSTSLSHSLEMRFHKNFRWGVAGSVVYEATKTIHNIFLTFYLTPKEYGFIASILSLIYLVTKFTDFGASTSILPFFHIFVRSKENFKRLLFRFYIFPHIPLLLISTIVLVSFLFYKFPGLEPTIIFVIVLIIFLESLRSFLRLFLYTSLICKKTVFIDVVSFLLYIMLIWVPYLFFNVPLSLESILIPHIIDSLLVTVLFSFLFYRFFLSLPDEQLSLPSHLAIRVFKTKVFNYLLRLSREVFTSNFLTPFFAFKFGFVHAGLFYLASVIAHSIQSVFKISVGYLGNAILANIKTGSLVEKQRAFELLTRKLTTLLGPLFIILFINHKQILRYANCSDLSMASLSLALLFLIIQIIDFIISLYEQFYVMEEASFRFFCYKSIEFLIFYLFISYSNKEQSLATILLGIISLKLVSFVIIALNAFYNWSIKPKFKVNVYYIIISLVVAFLTLMIL